MKDDHEACHHIQWAPLLDGLGNPIRNERGEVKHWVCSCGVIVPDPVDPHPENQHLLIEELVRAARAVIATPVGPDESKAMTELRHNLKATLDEYDATEDS